MGKKSAKQVTNFLGTSALTRPLFALGAASMLFGSGSAYAIDANTLPQNPNVVGGKDSFSQSGNTLNVNQSTNRTVIDWRSFDIGSKAQVNFAQPGKSSIAVNRINGSTNPTDIEGGLHANGQVWILNPNGVFFGKGARVDAAGIVATTANIDDKAFMAGSNKLQMTGADHGSVENQGNISVGANGLAAFVAPSVRNSGTINATVGRVALAAGTTYTLDLAGDHLVELGLGSVKAVVDNSGKIVNPGGTIALTAKAAGQVVNSVVNVSGVVSASSVSKSGGTITLGADTVNTTSTAQLSADAGTSGNGGTITSVANVQGNYAGAFSAKGGSTSGDGGKVETSGKSVTITDGISVDTRATNGMLGNWTVDPIDISIVTGGDNGDTVGAGGSITVGSIEHALDTTSVSITTDQGTSGNGDISLQSSINATGPGNLTLTGRHLYETSGSTISLAGALTLDVNAVNNVTNPSGNWINDALGMVGTVAGGTTINLGAGTYAAGTSITKNDVTIDGGNQAKISVAAGQTGVTIDASDVTLENLEIAGPVVGDQATITWSDNSWGVQVTHATDTNVTIQGNNIHNLRTGILIANSGNPVSGAASGSILNNVIEDTKGGILVQYRDGTTFTISGNSQGQYGNEWGIVTGLQLTKISSDPSSARQAQILNWANANNGMTVLDRQYATGNRSAVVVDAAGTATAADDFGLGNGVGNERQPINNIQAGINAVVAGGTVNVLAGNYTLTGELDITKSLSLLGAGVGATNITSTSTGYGVFVDADNTTLSGFSYTGSSAGTYSFKIQAAPGSSSNWLQNFHMSNVAISGSKKTGLDLNGVANAVIDHVTVTGTTNGNGIALTDSANITITNSTTTGNAWGGLALYQHNADFDHQVNNIRVDGTNTFNEANGIYAEDESASRDFGTVNLAGQGITYVGKAHAGATDDYTFFQTTALGAEQLALLKGGSTATVQGYAGTNLDGNNVFYVDTVGGQAMSIQSAINTAAAGATINVGAGTYVTSGQVEIDKDLTITGDANARATITSGTVQSGGNEANAWILVDPNVDFSLSNVVLDGSSHRVDQALRNEGNTTINNVDFRNIGVASSYVGEAIESFGGYVVGGAGSDSNTAGSASASLTVTNSTFENIGRIGILVKGDDSTANISGITYTGKGAGDWLDYGVEFGAGGTGTVSNSTITGALGIASTDGSTSAGIQVTSFYGPGTQATIENNKITDNWAAVDVGYDNTDTSVVHAFGNNLSGNTHGVELESALATADFRGNYWGTADDVAILGMMTGGSAGSVDFSTYLTKGTDTSSSAEFQGDFSNLTVTTLGAGTDRIAGAEALATAGGTINVDAGTYAEDVSIGKQLEFDFDGATVNSLTVASGGAGSVLNGDLTATGAVTLNGATTVGGDIAAASITANDAFGLTGGATASGAIALNGANSLSGSLTGGSIALNGATTLAGNTTLDTSAADGAIVTAAIDGSTAGGQSLTIKAGKGSVTLGNLGAATRLGAVSDSSKTTLSGSTYKADSFLFGGDVTLASASTTLNTTQSGSAAGDITFKGDIFGTTDGGQSLTLIAGSGTGAKSANGDITLQNAGTDSVRLANLTVSGDDFTALTVWLSGSYGSTLTGNQVFAADTLHAGGNVNSTVGGDASGHIESQGDVDIAAKGDVSGNISGDNVNLSGDDVNSTVTASGNANVNGNTVEGSYTGDNVSIVAADNVDAAVNATNFTLVAPGGSVDGTWTNASVAGSGIVYLNGDPQIGVNPSQLVVEGFVLPAGTTIGPNGQLILPQGVLLGLLSPGGGKPKMILVHSVQELGQLLASGYSVIVIDLSTRGSNKPVQLASN